MNSESIRERVPLWPGEAPYSAFSPGQAQPTLEAYPVPGARGAVVVCPGGGYVTKAPHEGAPIAGMINEAGVSAYVLDYRVKPCHIEAPLSDAKRAVRVVRAMGYEKVAILGFSAGGHLCCSAATLYDAGDPASDDPVERLSSRPDGFIPCYAVVSFLSFPHQGSVGALLGDRKGETALKERFSAEQHVTDDTPPAFIWHTAADQGVPVGHSLLLAQALARCGVPMELHIFPEGRHGLGLAKDTPGACRWPALLQGWLIREGYGK